VKVIKSTGKWWQQDEWRKSGDNRTRRGEVRKEMIILDFFYLPTHLFVRIIIEKGRASGISR